MKAESFGAVESDPSPENEKELGIDFFVSDHNASHKEFTVEELRELYAAMKEYGLSSVRFDVAWDKLAPTPGMHDEASGERYGNILKTIKEVGMKPPTIVISNPPPWAEKVYATDKEKYFEAYEAYLASVAKIIERSTSTVYSAQLFNEINNATLYKFIDVKDIPRCAEIARKALGAVQPDIKIATSIIAGNISDRWPEKASFLSRKEDRPPVEEYLDRNGPMLKKNFDLVQIDYYPGVWHLPVGDKASTAGNLLGRKDSAESPSDPFTPRSLNATMNNFALFKAVAEKLSALGIPYEIGESGFPTNVPYSTEDRQRFAYDTYFRALRQIFVDFKKKGVALPERVGIFSTQDTVNPGYGGVLDTILKIPGAQKLARLSPTPENDWGLRKKSGRPKSILQDKRKHLPLPALFKRERSLDHNDQEDVSQLSRIIKYVNRPIAAGEGE